MYGAWRWVVAGAVGLLTVVVVVVVVKAAKNMSDSRGGRTVTEAT
jgi:hypothetical protein